MLKITSKMLVNWILVSSILFQLFRGFQRNQIIHTGALYIVVIFIIVLLTLFFNAGKIKLPKKAVSFYIPYLFFITFIIVSFALNYNLHSDIDALLSYLFNISVFLFFPIMFSKVMSDTYTYPNKLITYIFFIYILLTLFDFGNRYGLNNPSRYNGLITSVNQFGVAMATIFSMSIISIRLFRNSSLMYIYYSNLIFSFGFLLLSGSRGALAITILWFFIYTKIYTILKSVKFYLFTVFIVMPIVFYKSNEIYTRMIEPFIRETDISISHEARMLYYSIFMNNMSVSQFFYGRGIGNFDIYGDSYPHNIFLEIGNDLGVIIAIVVLSFFYLKLSYLIKYFLNDKNISPIITFALITLFSTFYTAQSSLTVQMFVIISLLSSLSFAKRNI